MKKIIIYILTLLIVNQLSGQQNQNDNCHALNMVLKTKLFIGSFNISIPERRDSVFVIIDTSNYFDGFSNVSICNRVVEISNVWSNKKSVNTVIAQKNTITFNHFALFFFCPATGVESIFIFERKRNKKGILNWKIIGTSSGSY